MGKTVKNLKNAIRSVATKSNKDFWDLARRFSPSFKSHTAEATAIEFSTKGYEAITMEGTQTLNEFFEISMRVAFQMLNVSRAKNPLVDRGLIQVYDTPNGGYVQRMAVHSIKPVSPKFKNLKDGDSIDPFVVRKPKVDERFFEMNFDYQNLVTVQEYQLKTMFINEYGMGELLAGILEGLANGYTIQEYLNAKECIDAAISSTKNPLRDTQKMTLSNGWYDADPTEKQMKELILSLKDTATRMNTVPQTGMYNALGFESVVDPEDHVLLMRAGVKNAINTGLLAGIFHPDFLDLPFEIVEVDNFGGLIPCTEGSTAESYTVLDPMYGPLGDVLGFIDMDAEEYQIIEVGDYEAELDNWDDTPVQHDGVWCIKAMYTYEDDEERIRTVTKFWPLSENAPVMIDPHADVLAVLMQKGAIFETAQNPYQVTPIYNPRGLYTNYIASRPNTGIAYDALYNVIVFYKGSTSQPDAETMNVKVVNTSSDKIPVNAGTVTANATIVNTAESPVLTQEVTPGP